MKSTLLLVLFIFLHMGNSYLLSLPSPSICPHKEGLQKQAFKKKSYTCIIQNISSSIMFQPLQIEEENRLFPPTPLSPTGKKHQPFHPQYTIKPFLLLRSNPLPSQTIYPTYEQMHPPSLPETKTPVYDFPFSAESPCKIVPSMSYAHHLLIKQIHQKTLQKLCNKFKHSTLTIHQPSLYTFLEKPLPSFAPLFEQHNTIPPPVISFISPIFPPTPTSLPSFNICYIRILSPTLPPLDHKKIFTNRGASKNMWPHMQYCLSQEKDGAIITASHPKPITLHKPCLPKTPSLPLHMLKISSNKNPPPTLFSSDLCLILPSERVQVPKHTFHTNISSTTFLTTPLKQSINTKLRYYLPQSIDQSHYPFIDTQKVPCPPYIDCSLSLAQKIMKNYDKKNLALKTLPLIIPTLDVNLNSAKAHQINQSSRITQALLSEIPTLSSLDTLSIRDAFDTRIQYSPRKNGKGYYFALHIKPNNLLYLEPPPKHVLFVIDGSNTIKRSRFNIFKKGIAHALPYLKKGDTFNILISDLLFTCMSKTPIAWSRQSLINARHFLYSRPYKGFSVYCEIFGLITQALPYLNPQKENIILLLTDGHSLYSPHYHREELIKLIQSKLSIFTASVQQNNNCEMLKLISTFNSGESTYANTYISFPRKLAVLTKHIGNILSKKIRIQIANDSHTNVKLYSDEYPLAPLYFNRPYVLYGTIKELKDFDLFLQSKVGDQWINIKQHISFKNAERASLSIKCENVLQQIHLYHFLRGTGQNS